MTEDQYAAIKKPAKRTAPAKTRTLARPRPTHTPGAMNKTEALFLQDFITPRLRSQEFISSEFESVKLRLAKATFYTPDFFVVTPSEILVFEVKGFWEDDARVKIKVAADKYPYFRFIAVQKKTKKQGGGWKFEEFNPA